MDTATREIFWNIDCRWVFYAMSCGAALVFCVGLWKKISCIRRGAPHKEEIDPWTGFTKTMRDLLVHATIRREPSAGIAHVLMFYSFGMLFVVTLYVMVSEHLVPGIFCGRPYLVLSLSADLAGISMIVGVAIVLGRRAVRYRTRHGTNTETNAEDIGVLLLMGFLAVSGLMLEGLRIRLDQDPWKAVTPGGWVASTLCAWIQGTHGVYAYQALWWIHALASLGFIAWVPFSKLFHMIGTPANLVLRVQGPCGRLVRTDLRDMRTATTPPDRMGMGYSTFRDVTWKQRLEVFSCMRCGRCQDMCPAVLCDQPLSPRRLVQDMKNSIQKEPRKSGIDCLGFQAGPAEAVTREALWACRVCRACEVRCPAGIRHVPQIIEMRRGEVMGSGRLPVDAAQALRNLSRTGNPYGASPGERERWIRENQVAVTGSSSHGHPLLLWTGCFNQGDELKARVLSSVAGLLKKLAVPFVVTEGYESCCGEPARNLGDEDLFQSLARRQIQRIDAMGIETILVHCPHCYTILKDEYPTLGASCTVVHTSEFLMDCMSRGFPLTLEASGQGKRIVFHDSCFLGRYHEIYDAPRHILKKIPGIEIIEPWRSRDTSLCCGAGGGHFFMDLDEGERPASKRIQEILAYNADILCVSCTFCMHVFEDALRIISPPRTIQVADWMELLAIHARRSDG